MTEVQNGGFSNPELNEKLKEMWNTEEYADTIFLVNETKFYASSHLVSVMSSVLKDEIKNHFDHCGDREIRIGNIKRNESFSIILKYIYGMKIEFTGMDGGVLCEVLPLSEQFELTRFTAELKSFTSKLDCFQLDSLVVLLNTAKKYEMKDLYEKLTAFAFENANLLVKHVSFVDLQYDVLRDLLKADYFLTQEIDILLGTLHWHKSNINESSYQDKGSLMEEIQNTVVNEAEPSEASSDDLDNITDVLRTIQSTDEASGQTENLNTLVAKENAISNLNSNNSAVAIPDRNILKTFSDKVLKSLLMYIRIKQISVIDFMNVLKSDLVKPHKDILLGCTSSALCEPRRKFVSPSTFASEKSEKVVIAKKDSVLSDYTPLYCNICCENMYDKVKKFTLDSRYFIRNIRRMTFHKSEGTIKSTREEIENFKWQVEMDMTTDDKAKIILICIDDENTNWDCFTEFQMRLISPSAMYRHCTLLDSSDSTHFIKANFHTKANRVEVGTFNLPTKWKELYSQNGHYTIEVYFQYIHKMVKDIKEVEYRS